MVRIYPNEQFKEIEMDQSLKLRYAISNKGRLLSFKEKFTEGRILNGGKADGYTILRYKIRKENEGYYYKFKFFYKLVAEYFIPKTSEDQKYVLHLDYVRDNDDIKNLKWATYDEMILHGKKSPHVIIAKKKLIEFNINSDGKKLTATKVIRIKKMLSNPNRTTRLRLIAKQFGISQTHLKRIETGENWGHIKI